MISPGYIARQFRAVMGMAQNHPLWREWLDADADGFYRSFWAVIFAMPLMVATRALHTRLLHTLLNNPDMPEMPEIEATLASMPPTSFMSVLQVIVGICTWTGSIAVLIGISRKTGNGRAVSPLVAGYNWSELLIQLLTFAVFLLVTMSGATIFIGLMIGVFMFAIYLRFGILRRTLAQRGFVTVAIIGLLYLVQFLINMLVSGIGFGIFDAVTGRG